MGWYTLDSHSMTAKLVSHNEGQMLSKDAFESGVVKSTKNIDDSVTNSKKKNTPPEAIFGVFFSYFE